VRASGTVANSSIIVPAGTTVELAITTPLWAQSAGTGTSVYAETAFPLALNGQMAIPAGTRIALTLASPLTTKGAKPGAAVRAVTAFPITVGSQLVISVGTYVEGTIEKVIRGGSTGPTLQIHFNHILYTNGYTVPIDATNTQAQLIDPQTSAPRASAFACDCEPHHATDYAMDIQQSPGQVLGQPPPLPKLGPSMGEVIGIAAGVAAAGIVAIVLLAHHHGGGSSVLFDTGWQFEMGCCKTR
jgi:hypothetical protein